jgi:hypothetical protein
MKSIKNHRTCDSFVTLCQNAPELCKQCGICNPSQLVSYGSLDSITAEETQNPAPSRPKRSVKVVPSLRDYLITTTLGQREEISASTDINISTSEKNRPIISPWYNQLYLPVCDLLIEQLEFRFDSDSLTTAKAVGAVLCCDNRGIQPLVQQYASVLQVNLHLLESEMELFSSTDHSINLDAGLEVGRYETVCHTGTSFTGCKPYRHFFPWKYHTGTYEYAARLTMQT